MKFQVNWMKIGNFINVAFVDLLSDVYLLSKDDLKTNHWLNSVTRLQMFFKFEVNSMKIDNFRNLAGVDLLAYVDLKTNHWLNSVTRLQMLFKFHFNR